MGDARRGKAGGSENSSPGLLENRRSFSLGCCYTCLQAGHLDAAMSLLVVASTCNCNPGKVAFKGMLHGLACMGRQPGRHVCNSL